MKAYLSRAVARVRALIASAYNRAFSQKKEGWQKWALIAVITLAAAIVVCLFVALVLFFCMLPGMIVGLFLWLPWTYLEQGERFFPGLDPIWHHLAYWDIAFATTAIYWTVRLLKTRRPAVKTEAK